LCDVETKLSEKTMINRRDCIDDARLPCYWTDGSLLLGFQLLPWGDKLTAESIQFFSPIVLWTRPGSREKFQETVFSAFKDYLAVNSLLHMFTSGS
jgi:hypothetical protein